MNTDRRSFFKSLFGAVVATIALPAIAPTPIVDSISCLDIRQLMIDNMVRDIQHDIDDGFIKQFEAIVVDNYGNYAMVGYEPNSAKDPRPARDYCVQSDHTNRDNRNRLRITW